MAKKKRIKFEGEEVMAEEEAEAPPEGEIYARPVEPVTHLGEEPVYRPEEDVLRRARFMRESQMYGKADVYKGHEVVALKERGILAQSWSYHYPFPSLRTWSSLAAIALAPYVFLILGIKISGGDMAAMWGMWWAGMALLFIAGFLTLSIRNVSHAVKDALVHGIVIVSIAVVYPWGLGAKGLINIAAIYITSHLLAHAVDFQLERARGRGLKLLILVVILTWVLLGVGYVFFNLNNVSVFS